MAAKKSMQSKALKALSTGKNVTMTQLAKIGFANPRDAVYNLREAGYTVYTNKVKTRNGVETAYRMV